MSEDKPIAKAPLYFRKYHNYHHLALYVESFIVVSGICFFFFSAISSSSVEEVAQLFVYSSCLSGFGLILIIITGDSRIVVYSDYLYLPTWYPSVLFRPNRRSKLEYSKIENVTVYRYTKPGTAIAYIKLRNSVKVRKKPQILSTEHWKEGVVSKGGVVVIEKGVAGEKAFEKFLNVIKNRGITITTVDMSHLRKDESDTHISKLLKEVTITPSPVRIE